MIKTTLFKIPNTVLIFYCSLKNILIFFNFNKKTLNIKVNVKLIFFKKKKLLLTNFLLTKSLKTCISKFWFLTFYQLQLLFKFFFKKNLIKIKLNLVGIGFKFFISLLNQHYIIQIKAGFSHKMFYKLPINVKILLLKPTAIILIGTCYQTVFNVANSIKNVRLPDPYKKKGFLYTNEIIKIKQGKVG